MTSTLSIRSQAFDDVFAERIRVLGEEGRTPEDDDKYVGGELALAAAAYAVSDKISKDFRCPYFALLWPWSREWWKPKDRRRDLVRAGQLIIAEIERLDRAQRNGSLDLCVCGDYRHQHHPNDGPCKFDAHGCAPQTCSKFVLAVSSK